jgi:DNA-binding transcriptional regulator/RsmH inhibitor MraZ
MRNDWLWSSEQITTTSTGRQQSPRDKEYRKQLAKNISEIVIEKATDGNETCIEIYQRAKQKMMTRDDTNSNKRICMQNLICSSSDTTLDSDARWTSKLDQEIDRSD